MALDLEHFLALAYVPLAVYVSTLPVWASVTLGALMVAAHHAVAHGDWARRTPEPLSSRRRAPGAAGAAARTRRDARDEDWRRFAALAWAPLLMAGAVRVALPQLVPLLQAK